jgi:hypothetical protein
LKKCKAHNVRRKKTTSLSLLLENFSNNAFWGD